MNTCKTCVHWVDARLNKFGQPMNEHEWTKECHHPKLFESGDQYLNGLKEARDVLIYSYSEGGCFNTGPDFGCVHHQSSPAPTPASQKDG